MEYTFYYVVSKLKSVKDLILATTKHLAFNSNLTLCKLEITPSWYIEDILDTDKIYDINKTVITCTKCKKAFKALTLAAKAPIG